MRARWSFLLLILTCASGLVAVAAADEEAPDAGVLHAQGKALLAQADFDGALARFLAAARAAPADKAYEQDALLLKRVVAQRQALDRPERHPRWAGIALSLHAFYLQHGLHGEAIGLGRRGVATLADAPAEDRLVEALLEAGRDAEALQQLTSKATWTRGVRHTIFYGIALARLRRFAEAAAHATAATRALDGADPLLLRDAARLPALLGQQAPTAALLVRAFEGTQATQLDALKAGVRAHPDFQRVLASEVVTKAFAATSKQKAPGCSGGSDCGSCPSRGKCGGAK